MITSRATRGARALALGFSICNAGCNYAIYNNKDVRDAFDQVGKRYQGPLIEANKETIACLREEKEVLTQSAADAESTKGFILNVNSFLRNRALLNNPIEKEEDRVAVAVAVISAVGLSFRGNPKSEETMLSIYDWVTLNIGVDRENMDLTAPAETLSQRFANPTSRLLLLFAMLETAFPHSTRIVETHQGGKAHISLEFDLSKVEGMAKDVPKAEEALARAVSERYDIRLPAAMRLMRGSLKSDATGLWLTIDPVKGRESGLRGKTDDEGKTVSVDNYSSHS